jgi:stage III sporulation protein AE
VKKLFLLFLLLPLLLSQKPPGDAGGDAAEILELDRVEEEMSEEERAISGELRLDGGYDGRGALSRLWTSVISSLRERLGAELRFALSMVAIAFLCSLCSAFSPSPQLGEMMELAACCTAALLLAGGVDSVITQSRETLDRLTDYAQAAFPAFFTTVAACGASVSASVKYAAVCFAMDVFIRVSQKLILPVIYAFLAVSVTNSIFENTMLKTMIRLTKWCAITAMSLMTSLFCVYISLSGVISGSADALAVKTTKTVISTALPVVGGILSDSAAAMLSAAGLIKNSAGVFCLVAVCVLCAGSFVLLSVKMLVFKGSAAISELAGSGRYSQLLSNLGTAFGMLLGLVGCYGTMLFFSIMSGIGMVNV